MITPTILPSPEYIQWQDERSSLMERSVLTSVDCARRKLLFGKMEGDFQRTFRLGPVPRRSQIGLLTNALNNLPAPGSNLLDHGMTYRFGSCIVFVTQPYSVSSEALAGVKGV